MKRTWGVGVLLALSVAWVYGRQDEPFPHREHAAVFPLCTGCHVGIETGNTDDYYPPAEDCTDCHDGTTEELVDWQGPTARPTNLIFLHTDHADEVVAADDSATCQSCHQEPGTVARMAVEQAQPEQCLSCHTNATDEHLAEDADCQLCHMSLALATDLPQARVAELPQPPTHSAIDFTVNHAPDTPPEQTTCSVCHAQESCVRCHLNGAAVPVIAALPRDARIAAVTAELEAEYPLPLNHEDAGWGWKHVDDAEAQPAGCANCHAQPSCRACHQNAEVEQITQLPVATAAGPQGVVFPEGEPGVHPTGFAIGHGPQAIASQQSCEGCHAQQVLCQDCHRGPSTPGFHMANYRERHGADAYGYESECISCHGTEVFCRSCHAGSGLASEGKLDVAFHTSQPFWLLGHGQSARQRLESCTTCHTQTDCTRCHSTIGAWRINPHGPDYDGTRAQSRNEFNCLQCHRSDPPDIP